MKFKTLQLFWILLTITCIFPFYSWAGPSAKAVLDASGIKGGIVVCIGCDDPEFLKDLRASEAYLVHGVDTSVESVAKARAALLKAGVYGPVTASEFDGSSLGYIDNTVNLIIASEPMNIDRSEILRVLCPGGVYLSKQGDSWKKITKPVPANTADWTHFLYDASGNAVSPDTVVDNPFYIQWQGGPKWARSHDRLSSLNSLVSANGRIFYVFDEGLTAEFYYPAKWRLIARDAYNGVILWKKDIPKWEDHWRAFRSGPTQLNRRVVCSGDHVFAAMGLGEPVSKLDAATGRTVKTFAGTEGTEEIIYSDGILYLVILPFKGEAFDYMSQYKENNRPGLQKKIMAVDTVSGRVLWEKNDNDTLGILPVTLITNDSKVYYQSRNRIMSLDKKTGRKQWKAVRSSPENRSTFFSPSLLVYKDVVISVDRSPDKKGDAIEQGNISWKYTASASNTMGELVAYEAATGKQLWTAPAAECYGAQMDCFVIDDEVFLGQVPRRNTTDFTNVYDVHSGKIVRTMETAGAFTSTHHHRCYRNKATSRYILLGRTGVEFIDITGEEMVQNAWTRGNCEYGIMPANGMVYVPPHACGCYIQVKLSGFFAYASKSGVSLFSGKPENKLVKGPAAGKWKTSKPAADDWASYRGGSDRSGENQSSVPAKLKTKWKLDLGGIISSPVIAGDSVYLASKEQDTIYAIDRSKGKIRWTFTAGGRIDSAPTVVGNGVFFGSRDGWVYGLLAESGKLMWKFRAAKSDRRHFVEGRLESVWPVHGSLLSLKGKLYFAAGCSSYIDDGLYIYALDPATGAKKLQKRIYSRDPETGYQPEGNNFFFPGGLSDILASDGERLFMRDLQLSLDGEVIEELVPHIHNTAGYLDDTWAHRTYWYYGELMSSGYGGWGKAGAQHFSGRLMVNNDKTLFGYGRQKALNDFRSAPALGSYADQPNTHLYAAQMKQEKQEPATAASLVKSRRAKSKPQAAGGKLDYSWSVPLPIFVKAMALADDTILVAGPEHILNKDEMTPGPIALQADLFQGSQGAVFQAISAKDGSLIEKHRLPSVPVYDGMAVAKGCVFISTEDGTLLCYGK